MQFSRRLLPDLEETPFFKKLESLKVQIKNYSDLTISTPMNAGITPDFSSAFQKVSFAFSPNASGSSKTREQIVSYYKERGGNFSADSVLLTCSTSEAYSILFKAFCNPGDVILTPVPGYPLLDTLAQLEFLKCYPYFLKQKENRFVVDTDSFLSAPERAKIFLLVSPHNPTGHVVSPSEWNAILDFCEERKLILIVDEVFGDYLYFEKVKRSWLYKKAKIPVFYLNGLSKIAGAPSIKLGWILSEVPPLYKQKIQNVLEFVFDAYLNVSAIAESIAVPLRGLFFLGFSASVCLFLFCSSCCFVAFSKFSTSSRVMARTSAFQLK